ncbi:uncharacterized protein EDB91DRAFT_1245178 [Suillus paluster]|uniref:uncharacterized protein n=1 Tax=Suillus paluster TaxID=48578 RepID=UPI001B87AC4F|nr:uncharacterized protein EDB91DRAFT_1245178 [Suillus paluster]KAG1748481.1 hypothetical protein EDB91DRAFT_1245178 [Suillus paluster]
MPAKHFQLFAKALANDLEFKVRQVQQGRVSNSMPPAHQRVCHSARLQADTRVHSKVMDPPAPSIPSSEGHSTSISESPGPRLTIQWQSESALTDVLVNYLTAHPADCRILFYSNGKKAMSPVDDQPSGLDKGQICTVIAKVIFTSHPKYDQAYQHNQKKFHNAVSNCITKSKYKKLKAQFSETGTGVMPLDGTASKNLLDSVLVELPWYMELDAIWHANPSMAAKTHSSKPGIDHAAALYSLIQLHGAGPLIGAHNMPPPAAYPPGVPPAAHPYGDPPVDPQLCQAAPAPAPPLLHLCGLNSPDVEIHQVAPCYDQRSPIDAVGNIHDTPAPAPPAPPPLHLRSLDSPDVEIEDNFIPPSLCNLERSPFDVPLGDTLDHLNDNNNNNDMMLDGTGTLNSPP